MSGRTALWACGCRGPLSGRHGRWRRCGRLRGAKAGRAASGRGTHVRSRLGWDCRGRPRRWCVCSSSAARMRRLPSGVPERMAGLFGAPPASGPFSARDDRIRRRVASQRAIEIDEGAVRLGIMQASGVAATSTDHIPDRRCWIWRSDRRHREQARPRHGRRGRRNAASAARVEGYEARRRALTRIVQ